MTQKVQLTQSIDDREVVQAFSRQNKLLDKLERKFDSLGQKGRRAGKETGSGFQNATAQVGQFVTAIAGVGSVLGAVHAAAAAVRREIEQLRRAQGLSAETQLQVAGAQREALLNLGNDKSLTANQLNRNIQNISIETGAGQAALFKAFSGAVSFKGQNLQSDAALEAVRVAASTTPDSAEAIQTGAEGILALKKVLPQARGVDIAGFLQAAKGAAPISSDAQFSKNIAPAIAQLTKFGDSPRESAALLTTLGQGIGDKEGNVTASAAINFARQLQEQLPDVQGGTIDRLRFLQSEQGAKIRAQLLGPLERQAAQAAEKGNLKSEAKAFTTLVGLLQGGGTSDNLLLNRTLQQLPTLEGAGADFQKNLDRVNAQPIQVNAAAARILKSAGEGQSIIDIKGGRASISRKGLRDVLERSGASAAELDASELVFELGTGLGENAPVEKVSDALRGRAQRLRYPAGTASIPLPGAHGTAHSVQIPVPHGFSIPGLVQGREATDTESAQARVLETVANQLDRLVELAEGNSGKVQQVEVTNPNGVGETRRREPAAAANGRGAR